MNIKKILSVTTAAFLMIRTCAFASVLGSEEIKKSAVEISSGAVLHSNSFYSDQSGVGLQTENYVEYKPNTDAVPVILNNWKLYGRNSVSQMASAVRNSGIYPVMLMNADFFSFQTGVPMSHQISDGILLTKDSSTMDAVGINSDGTAFISPLKINMTIDVGESSVIIDMFNKYRQPYAIYMMDDRFSDTTQATTPGINVIIGSLSGSLTFPSTVTGVVEKVVESDGAIDIPAGKIVLTADKNVPAEFFAQMQLFTEGSEVTIRTSAEGDERWNSVKYALGATGGRLIKNGEIQNLDESAAPRSALGIKADGTVVFYTIDGRQSGHSYGVRIKTLSKRLLELGCVDAINLDGGGSTAIGTVYPGNDAFGIINSPSDGKERKVSTLIGIYNTAQATGSASRLFMYPYSGNYLSGVTQQFTTLATDSGFYKAPTPSQLVYTAPDGTRTTDGRVRITGDGEVNIGVTDGSISGSVTVNCVTNPDAISVYNQDTSTLLGSVNIKAGDSVNLTAYASLGHKALVADDSCFSWTLSTPELGTVDSNGYFTAGIKAAEGSMTVSAGSMSVTLPVTVTTNEQSRTDITYENTAPGQVGIILSNVNSIGVKQENMSVYADGKPIDVQLEGNRINVVFGDTLVHKIKTVVKNDADLTSMAYFTTDGTARTNIFADTENHWAKNCIAYMNAMGVVNGNTYGGKTYFKPSDNITRAQFAVMTANMLGIDVSEYEGRELTTDDAASVPSWAANHVRALFEKGIMNGKQSGTKTLFDSDAKLTRAEAITVLGRLIQEDIRTGNAQFADSKSIPSWASDSFNKLAALGVISGYNDGTIRPQNNISRAETIKLLYEIY